MLKSSQKSCKQKLSLWPFANSCSVLEPILPETVAPRNVHMLAVPVAVISILLACRNHLEALTREAQISLFWHDTRHNHFFFLRYTFPYMPPELRTTGLEIRNKVKSIKEANLIEHLWCVRHDGWRLRVFPRRNPKTLCSLAGTASRQKMKPLWKPRVHTLL